MKETDTRVKVTKEMFHRALLGLLETKPIAKISVKELCEAAALNRGTFYLHYETVGDVLTEVVNEFIEDKFGIFTDYLDNIIPSKGKEHQYMSALFAGMLKDIDTYRILYTHGEGIQLTEAIKYRSKPIVINEWIKEYPEYSKEHLEFVFDYVMAGSMRIILSWADKPDLISTNDLAKRLDRLGHYAHLAIKEF